MKYVGQALTRNSDGENAFPTKFWVNFSLANGTLGDAQSFGRVIVPYNITVPVGLANSKVNVGANPTSQSVLSVRKNDVEFGTITIDSLGTATFNGTATSFTANIDVLSVIAPTTADTTLANVTVLIFANID